MSTALMHAVQPHEVLPIGRSTSSRRGLPLHKQRSVSPFTTLKASFKSEKTT
ncbi:hypothetical protein [Paenibacillus sp. CFBP 13594]|uniref:hypothetical protein n=1 Tax=Paenibacillus sp. CFBP 13594 TaxID=2774037 RepID=UPI001A7E7F7D|nr:hypothetical protein [Paenibacillus sp. CFBP 13594]